MSISNQLIIVGYDVKNIPAFLTRTLDITAFSHYSAKCWVDIRTQFEATEAKNVKICEAGLVDRNKSV